MLKTQYLPSRMLRVIDLHTPYNIRAAQWIKHRDCPVSLDSGQFAKALKEEEKKTLTKTKPQRKLMESSFEKSLPKCCQLEADACPAAQEFIFIQYFYSLKVGLVPLFFCASQAFFL